MDGYAVVDERMREYGSMGETGYLHMRIMNHKTSSEFKPFKGREVR
jgi:hypothetical protein